VAPACLRKWGSEVGGAAGATQTLTAIASAAATLTAFTACTSP
jgi:hypothetical protein